MVVTSAQEWAEQTFRCCDLRDVRQTFRLISLAAAQSDAPGLSTEKARKGDRSAAHADRQWLENPDVDYRAVLEGGAVSALEQCDGHGDVLVCCDTTTLVFHHEAAERLGDISGPDNPARGWLVHSAVLMDSEGLEFIGLGDQHWWTRDPDRPGKAKRKGRRYEEKESFKWEQQVRAILGRVDQQQAGRLIFINDSEADIYDLMEFAVCERVRLVIRASQDRVCLEPSGLLDEVMASQPIRLAFTIHLRQMHHRPARTAVCAVKYAPVTLARSGKSTAISSVSLWCVQVEELDPPDDVEPLAWTLLTTEPVNNDEDALKVVIWYRQRWHACEDFHRAWKTGCRAQERRGEPDNLQRHLVVLAFIAIRLLQLQDLGNRAADTPCTRILTTDQWQALHAEMKPNQPLPADPPDCAWAMENIAMLGGWTDSKHTGRIGWETFWDGWFRLDHLAKGWAMARRHLASHPP